MSGGGGELRGRDAQDVVCQLSGSERLICGQLAMTLHVCSPGAMETWCWASKICLYEEFLFVGFGFLPHYKPLTFI